jgi:uncharacterized membrane protein
MVYLILKLIHIFGAIIFLGNITIGPFWKMHAERSNDPKKIADTFDGIIKADRFFTMPGAAIIIIFGIGAALHGGYNLITTSWIFWSLILIVISGAVFMAKVAPIQKKIFALASDESKFNWDEYKNLAKQWDIWGSIATIAPYIAIVLMVIKPA